MLGIKVYLFQLLIIYLIPLIWSILYHLVPGIRSNSIYRFLSHTVSICMVMLAWVNLYYMMTAPEYIPLVHMALFVFFTGPSSFVGITLLLLLNLENVCSTEDSKVMYAPSERMQLNEDSVFKINQYLPYNLK